MRVLFTILLLALASPAWAATCTKTAASLSTTDVQAALNAAVAGDVVCLPAGTATWTTSLTWNAPANVTLQGAGSQSVIGGGDATVIIDSLDRTSGDNGMLTLMINATGTFRLTGITFRGIPCDATHQTYQGTLRVGGGNLTNLTPQFRMDHVHLDQICSVGMTIGAVLGVIDHVLVDQLGSTWNGIKARMGSWNGRTDGDGSWADDTTLGTGRFIYIEDTTLNRGFFNDCDGGGRFVFRHNTINSGNIQTHATGHGFRDRGCRAWEIYSNIYNCVAPLCDQNNPVFTAFYLTSGTGVMWNNSALTGYNQFISAHNNRSNNFTYSRDLTPLDWGYCGTAFNGTGSNWDQNSDVPSGYACLDQIGRGRGDLLSGQFPNAINTRTGTIAWPQQLQEPVYEWLNAWNPVPGFQFSVLWGTNETPAVVVENRDYYLHAASFNGTVGTGTGLLSARPATCTPKVAYWATDTTTLYQCSSTNSWTVYYTPYTYPHPLVSGAQGIAPNAPSIQTVR